MAMQWERQEAGCWHLHDKPGETPRQRLSRLPVAWVTGMACIGFHGGIFPGCDAQFHGRTVQAVKRQIDAHLAPNSPGAAAPYPCRPPSIPLHPSGGIEGASLARSFARAAQFHPGQEN